MKAAAAILLLLSSTPLFAQAGSDVQKAIDEAMKPSSIERNLQVLTDQIGGRVPGTPAMQRAIDWAVQAFKAAGADKVHTEKFQIAHSWAEGDTRVDVVAPVHFHVRAVSIAYAPAITPVRARVVDVGRGSEEEFAKAGNVSGAILLVHSKVIASWDDLFAEYMEAPPILERAARGKAAVVAFTSTREHDLLYRHNNSLTGSPQSQPAVLLAREDSERVARLLKSGERVEMQISAPNKIGAPIETANVIAEIQGAELPDEFVILGAHLDSWELGTGALDNGCSSALVIDTLRAMKAAGIRPRRSVRFILFSGEEEGMLGSFAYARAHRNELDKADAVVIFDSGTGRVTGFSLGGRHDIADRLQQLAAPLQSLNATTMTFDAPIGTDNFDFLLEGVPNLIANQDAENYLVNYHASSDTYDKVDLGNLKKMTAIAAGITTAIANAPERLGRRQSRDEIEKLLRDAEVEPQMKVFGMWSDWQSGKRGRAK